MTIALQYPTEEEIPEALRAEYAQTDGEGVWLVDIEGGLKTNEDVEKTMTSLKAERAAHSQTKGKLKAFGEHTPETIEELSSTREELQVQVDAHGAPDEEQMENLKKLVDVRVGNGTRPLERQIETLTKERDDAFGERDVLRTERDQGNIVTTVTRAGKEVGIEAAPLGTDVASWAGLTFELVDDVVVQKNTGLTPKDVLTDMKAAGDRPHWFGPTVSADARGGKAGIASGENPFARDAKTGLLKDSGKAMGLTKSDPEAARRLAKAANFPVTW